MKDALANYQCPNCGKALSYTALFPRFWAYEAHFPDLKVPLVRICITVVLAGFLLGAVHPLLAAIAVLGIGVWTWHQYFAPLQCDGCRSYFISGQFKGGTGRRLPWTKARSRQLMLQFGVSLAIIATVLGIIYGVQSWVSAKCNVNCDAMGLRMDTKARLFECNCVGAKP